MIVEEDDRQLYKWNWMMDYCKKHTIPPAQEWAWKEAETAYNKEIKEGVKMNIKLYQSDQIRIESGENIFIDVSGEEYGYGIGVTGFYKTHYIEIRRKDTYIKTFYFKNQKASTEIDLGYWNDAEIIFSVDEA